MITRTQLITVGLLFVFWLAGCTMGQAYSGATVPPPPAATLDPCATLTVSAATSPLTATNGLTATTPLTGAAPLTGAQGLTGTAPITATPAATATLIITIAPPLTPTITVTVTPPITLTPAQTLTATIQPTRTVVATQTGTVTPRAPIAHTGTTTSTTTTPRPTAVASAAPPATITPPATATSTPAPTVTSTATRAATATAPITASPTPTATGGTPTATPTPAPVGEVYVRSHRGFARDSVYHVVGEVVNALPGPVFGVRITSAFFNASGQQVATQESYAFLAQTSPDQRNPFRILVDNPGNDIATYQLAVHWDEISVVTYQDLTILSQQVSESDGAQVVGEVQNDFPENLGSVIVAVALYDEAGEVVDVYQGTPRATQMAPNEISPYAIPIAPDLPFTSFSVQAQGKRAIFF